MNDTGERFWHHRKKAAVKYNPTSLHKTLVDYFDWATDNPLIELKAFSFQGDSDAMIVRGLVAVLVKLYSGLSAEAIAKVDAPAELDRLGLTEHLSAQRSNGVRAMVERIRAVAAS